MLPPRKVSAMNVMGNVANGIVLSPLDTVVVGSALEDDDSLFEPVDSLGTLTCDGA